MGHGCAMCMWWYIINKNMLGIFNLAAAFD